MGKGAVLAVVSQWYLKYGLVEVLRGGTGLRAVESFKSTLNRFLDINEGISLISISKRYFDLAKAVEKGKILKVHVGVVRRHRPFTFRLCARHRAALAQTLDFASAKALDFFFSAAQKEADHTIA